MFEITHVEQEHPNWYLGKYFIFKAFSQYWIPNDEKFATGSPDLDTLNNQYDNQFDLSIASNKAIKNKETEIIDFSETNPFSGM